MRNQQHGGKDSLPDRELTSIHPDGPDPDASERPAGSRRQFLGWAGAGTALLLVGCESTSAQATAPPAASPPTTSTGATSARASVPNLSARDHKRISGNVQHFVSRPDLLPPAIVIDKHRHGSLGGLVVTESHLGKGQSGPLICDQYGHLVYFLPMSRKASIKHRAFNVRVQHYRGKPVLAWFQGAVFQDHGQGHYKLVDTSYHEVAQVHAANGYKADLHDFVLTKENTALFTCYGTAYTRAPVNGHVKRIPYTYGVVQEIDVATGKLLFEWRSDHHVPLKESHMPVMGPTGKAWDYFHINSVAVDPADNNLIISSRNTWTIYKVNRKSGKVMWRLGGRQNQFSLGRGVHFAFQHDAEMHPGGELTIFDNNGGPPKKGQSRALVLAVDEKRRRATLRHVYKHHPPLYSNVLGSVQPVGQNFFVGWGRTAVFTEFSRSGEVLFDGHLAGHVSSYRAFLQQWNGMPTTRPAVKAIRGKGHTNVYVSWNGATEVARWGVFGGGGPHKLSLLGTAHKKGFETEISVPSVHRWMAVAAYDHNGKKLGVSAAVRA